MVVVHCD